MMSRLFLMLVGTLVMGAYSLDAGDDALAGVKSGGSGVLSSALGGGKGVAGELAKGNLTGALIGGASSAGQSMSKVGQLAANTQKTGMSLQEKAMGAFTGGAASEGNAAEQAELRDQYLFFLGTLPPTLPLIKPLKQGQDAKALVTQMLSDSKFKALQEMKSKVPASMDDPDGDGVGFLPQREVVNYLTDLLLAYMECKLKPDTTKKPAAKPAAKSAAAADNDEDDPAAKAAAEAAVNEQKVATYDTYTKGIKGYLEARTAARDWENVMRFFGDLMILKKKEAFAALKKLVGTTTDAAGKSVTRTTKSQGEFLAAFGVKTLDALTEAALAAEGVLAKFSEAILAKREEESMLFDRSGDGSFIDCCDDACAVGDEEDSGDPVYVSIKDPLLAAREALAEKFASWKSAFEGASGGGEQDPTQALAEKRKGIESKLDQLEALSDDDSGAEEEEEEEMEEE